MTTWEARYKALLRRITEISDMKPRPAAKALAAVVYAHNTDISKRAELRAMKPGRPGPDQATLQQACAMRQQGCTHREIGAALGVSISTSSRWARQSKK
jgi:hypothetical protein